MRATRAAVLEVCNAASPGYMIADDSRDAFNEGGNRFLQRHRSVAGPARDGAPVADDTFDPSGFAPAPSVSLALDSRRSVRAFLDTPVDATLLRDLLQRAARAPSGGNLQPWRLVALGGAPLDELRDRMAGRLATNPAPDQPEYPIYPPALREPYRSNRYRIGEMLYERLGVAREDKAGRLRWFARNYRFFGAPVGLFCYVDRSMGSAQWVDLGMYLQSLMLLLREHGLDSCAQECWSAYHTLVDQFLAAPAEHMLFCGMAIGYADPQAPQNLLRSERLPLEAFASFRGI